MCFKSAGKRFSPLRILLITFLLITRSISPCLADDIGLVTVKLTEKEDGAYVLETNLPPQLMNTIGVPIFPEGFDGQQPEFEQRGALVNVRYPFTGTAALGPEDTILLPWSRTGVLVNARWADGTRASHLFTGKPLEGIAIEVAQIKTFEQSPEKALREGFLRGVQSFSRNWILWIPILCIGLLFPIARAFRFLAMLTVGLAAALFLLDIYPITVEPALALSMIMVAVILAIRLPESRLAPVFAATACLVGLAGGAEFSIPPRIAFIGGMVLVILAAGSALILLRRFLPGERFLAPAQIVIGGIAFAAILITLLQPPSTAEAEALPSAPPPAAASGKPAPGQAKLDVPFKAFVTIEPYEVRVEILASGEAITRLLEFPLNEPNVIEVGEQGALKEKAVDELRGRFTLEIDGQRQKAEIERADFVTLGAAGAFTRTETVEEALETSVLGLTFGYPLTALPQSIVLTWNRLPITASELPATVLEPSGTRGFTFTSDQLRLEWTNQSDELRQTSISAVDVTLPTWAPLSMLLLLAGLAVTAKSKPMMSYGCIALALLTAPFFRLTVPLVSPLPEEQAGEVLDHLLTNIYRAFDFRKESTIYDQLAVSVSGEQLTEVYLEQRRALELANRGGARTRVDNVEVESVESVTPAGDGVDVHARWNVSGSVNHFGHTHYRRNAYDAILRLEPFEGVWKITGIEVNEETRVF